MSNKKLRITINNNSESNSYDVLGSYNDNIYEYLEPDTNTKVLFDAKNLTLKRSNNELDMTYDFIKKIGNIYIKELERELKLEINLIEKIIEEEKVLLKYSINEDIFNYLIEVK